jgi:DNA-binding CsgD family transcriptional regulator
MLEREHECETLARAIAVAARGAGAIVAVEGEAGAGKTTLLAHAARCASESGMRVLCARGRELERDVSHGVVRQLFEPVLATATNDEHARWLAGAARLAAAAVSGAAPVGGHSRDGGPILHGLYWLSANLAAERPLLLLIDDVQWADGASLAFLSHLARRVDELPILILHAARTGERRQSAMPTGGEPDHGPTVLRPAMLGVTSTEAILRAHFPASQIAPRFARACHAATGGNPFLLVELARWLRDDGVVPDDVNARCVARVTPATITHATLARLERLDAAANALACAVAVLGTPAELPRAAALAGLDQGVAARAARLLARDGVDDVALAGHLLATEPAGDAWVVERLGWAAQAASARGADEAACTYHDRARPQTPPPQVRAHVLMSLGSAELRLEMPEAVEHLGEALHYAPDTAMRFAAAEELTWALAFCGRWPEAFALGHQVLASMAPYDEAALRFEGRLAALAQRSAATARPALERLERLERYEHRLVGETAGERLVLACLSFRAANRGDTATTTADFARRALADGRLLHDDELGGPNFLMAVGGLLYTDRLDEADHHLGLALEAARSQGSETAFAAASGLRCQALLRRGRLVRAEAEALAALAAVDVRAAMRPMLLASVLSAMLERADPTTWEAFLVEQRIDGDLGDSPDPAPLLLSRARMRLALGDARAALRDLDDLRRRDERSGLDNPWTPSRAYRALAHLQLGEREEAAGLAADELTRAGRWGTPSALGGALRTMASVQGGDEAIELLRAAVAALDHSPARYELACTLAELGAALRRAGRFGEARQPLRRALEIADKCGAARLARATRDELLVVGARPRRAARRGCHPLTPRERRIAQLAAEGQANRDIAQALFMTVRMVETHLSHVYAKLDVLSPDRLAAALHA